MSDISATDKRASLDGAAAAMPADKAAPAKAVVTSHDLDATDERLQQLGYAPEMRRNLSIGAVIGLGAGIIAAPFGLSTSAAFALINGGATSYFWGWALLSLISVAIAASLGEVCSLYPSSGGVYVWTAYLAPRKASVLASFIVGWISVIANITLSISIAFGEAQLIMAGISVFRNNEWAPETWHTILCFWAVMIFAAAVNAFGVKGNYLELLNVSSMWWTGATSIIILITTLAMSDDKRSAREVFAQWENTSGWRDGWSFFIGLLTPAYVLTGYGTISALCEEVVEPERAVPRAMVGSVLAASLTGFLYVLPLAFVLPLDLDSILTSAAGQPVVVLFSQVTGSAGGAFGLLFLILGIGLFASVGSLTVAIRCTWAFSRDGGLPGSRWLRVVNKRLDVPLNSLFVSTALIMALGLIYFGATAAFSAFTGACTILLGVSYVFPVVMVILQGRRPMRDAPWSLGVWGWVANIVALTWVLFSIVLFCFPTTAENTPETINYASVVVVFFACGAAVYYFAGARKFYTGPLGVLEEDERMHAIEERQAAGAAVPEHPISRLESGKP